MMKFYQNKYYNETINVNLISQYKHLNFLSLVVLLNCCLQLEHCKKVSVTFSAILNQLQDNWTLLFETVQNPSNPALNLRYEGKPGEYYLFGTDNTLSIYQAADPFFPLVPLEFDLRYMLTSNNTLRYDSLNSTPVSIQTLNNQELVLTNTLVGSFIVIKGDIGTYNGIKTDSLMRNRSSIQVENFVTRSL